MVGLALSALAKSNEQIMPLLVIAIMSQLVFQGGMIPVTGRIVLDQMSWVTPARWGFASYGIDDRSDQAGARPADAAGFALETHRGHMVVQHGHAGGDLRRLSELRAVEDSTQGRLSSFPRDCSYGAAHSHFPAMTAVSRSCRPLLRASRHAEGVCRQRGGGSWRADHA